MNISLVHTTKGKKTTTTTAQYKTFRKLPSYALSYFAGEAGGHRIGEEVQILSDREMIEPIHISHLQERCSSYSDWDTALPPCLLKAAGAGWWQTAAPEGSTQTKPPPAVLHPPGVHHPGSEVSASPPWRPACPQAPGTYAGLRSHPGCGRPAPTSRFFREFVY